MTEKKFKVKYGHLRPNSYDINSKNYNEGFKSYFSKTSSKTFDTNLSLFLMRVFI